MLKILRTWLETFQTETAIILQVLVDNAFIGSTWALSDTSFAYQSIISEDSPPQKQHPLTTEILGNETTCRILVSGSKAIFCNTCMHSLACGLLKHFALTAAFFFECFLFEVQHQWAGTGNKQETISKFIWVNYITSQICQSVGSQTLDRSKNLERKHVNLQDVETAETARVISC